MWHWIVCIDCFEQHYTSSLRESGTNMHMAFMWIFLDLPIGDDFAIPASYNYNFDFITCYIKWQPHSW